MPRSKKPLEERKLYKVDPIPEPVLIESILQQRGNMTRIAEALGCSRKKVIRAVAASEEAQKAVEQSREILIDQVENVFRDRVLQGRTKELLFFLKTQARRRGYSERNLTINVDVSGMSDEELENILNL